MLFNSLEFLIFFPLVLLIYFIVPKKVRYIWLLIISYYFYMSWNPKYAAFLVFSTLITYFTGILIEQARDRKAIVKGIFILCLVLNFSMLLIFKYTGFAVQNIKLLLSQFHITMSEPELSLLLPVGISFFTFQSAGYLIDVYRGDVKAERNILKYALFLSFFPNILSGPIERAKNMLPQIDRCKDMKLWNYERITTGAVYMLWGYFLKMVVADRTACLVNTVFGNYRMYGSTALVLATLFFAIQIYCDFASYSYLALGAAKILGFTIIKNFDAPYLSKSIGEFWRRWHISLSSWLRDYIYIPLGGNRKGTICKYRNTMIVFLISGIWHGASWGYIVWGMLHGIYIVVGELTKPFRKSMLKKCNVKTEVCSYRALQTLGTFLLVCFSWIFFKMEKLSAAIEVIRRIAVKWDPWTLFDGSLYTWGLIDKDFRITVLVIIVLFIVDYIRMKKGSLITILNRQNIWCRWGIYLLICCAVVIWGQYGAGHDPQAFLYFSY